MDPFLKYCVDLVLEEAGGDAAQAQRLLMARARGDDRLLRLLAEPFLQGLAAHAVNEHGGKPVPPPPPPKPAEAEAAPAAKPKPAALDPEILSDVMRQVDRNVQAGFPGKVVKVSPLHKLANEKLRQPPRQNSQRQANVMRRLASAYRKDEEEGA
jgi:hypothetical protein